MTAEPTTHKCELCGEDMGDSPFRYHPICPVPHSEWKVDILSKDEWKPLSENAHLICFGKHKPVDLERIDFVLMVRHGKQAVGYVTCRELDGDTLYWQFGGAFPGSKGTVLSPKGIDAFLEWCRRYYKRVSFLVENTNQPMLKMAMRSGFKIMGVRVFGQSVLLEHLLEF